MRINRTGWLVIGLIVGSTSLVIAQAENPDNLMIGGPGPHYIKRGKVGIGKTNPAAELDVNGSVAVSGKLAVEGLAKFNGSALIYGAAGVNTATPTEGLDVVGNVKLGKGPSAQVTVTQDIDSIGKTALFVSSTTDFPPVGTVGVHCTPGSSPIEAISYSSKDAVSLKGLVRGALGTAPCGHFTGLPVLNYLLTVQQTNAATPRLVMTSNFIDNLSGSLTDGGLGLGTSFPTADLHVVNPNGATVTFEGRTLGGGKSLLEFNVGASQITSGAAQSSIQVRGGASNTLDLIASNSGAPASSAVLQLSNTGKVSIGKNQNSLVPTVETDEKGYFLFTKTTSGPPPTTDCISNFQRGRMTIDIINNRLYICNGASRGWDYSVLSN